ncbi:hypothetical protein [Metabacillus sp. Hm71]|uniref:hypothetical protein n=1 Tax=Metabacillus sp. Hm71 TaxID=3450743 RepID=UPI003F4390E3
MKPFDLIWDYVGACYDNEAYIPDCEEVEEAIGHDLTLDGLEMIEEVIERFIGVSDMNGVDNQFVKPKTHREKMAELEKFRVENQREVS